MPELPEVECIRAGLALSLVGSRLTAARLLRPDMLTRWPITAPRAARQSTTDGLLEGERVESVVRLGKQIAICAATGPVLVIQLGMSGHVLVVPPGEALPPRYLTHVHAQWRIEPAGSQMFFRDPRRFGGLGHFPDRESLIQGKWSRLGPDALSISAPALRKGLSGTGRAIKSALLDQGVLAGVGNIYADEALHLAGVHPATPACLLTSSEVASLATAIRKVLRDAVRSGGSTLRDYVGTGGAPGGFQRHHLVYGLGGKPCRRCRSTICTAVLGGRTTAWCPGCQPLVHHE